MNAPPMNWKVRPRSLGRTMQAPEASSSSKLRFDAAKARARRDISSAAQKIEPDWDRLKKIFFRLGDSLVNIPDNASGLHTIGKVSEPLLSVGHNRLGLRWAKIAIVD
jgi:hypothetical protein